MNIQPFFDPRTATITYVVFDEATRDAVVIDPVLDYDPSASRIWTESCDVVVDFVQQEALQVRLILETHAHADHISGAQYLKGKFETAEIAIGREIRQVQQIFKGVFGLPEQFATDGSQFDRLLADGELFSAGSLQIEAIATPGHTPACLTYRIGDAVFTGDTLFMPDVGTGRCDFPGGSAEAMYSSIHDTLYQLPDTTRVFVGHDYPRDREVAWETTIGAQKSDNVALRDATDREDYVAWRNGRDASLSAPRLLFQSVQVNIDAGKLPDPATNEVRYLRIPLNVFRPDVDVAAGLHLS